MKDLTKGYPAKVIILFAIPMIFGSIFQQLYNIADSKIVSTFVGTEAFAAVGATSVVSNTLIGFLNSLTLGFAIPIANSFGGKDYKRMRRMVAGTVLLTLAGAVVLTVLILLLIPAILKLLATPEDIMSPALAYVRIILYGIIFVSVYNMCANVLRAVGDSRTPLYCLIISVFVNIGLDLLFVNFIWGFRVLPGRQSSRRHFRQCFALVISCLSSGILYRRRTSGNRWKDSTVSFLRRGLQWDLCRLL